MKVFVEAIDKNGKSILGTLDGQNVINAKNYRRTNVYKCLINLPKERLSIGGRAVQYKLYQANSTNHYAPYVRLLETIDK